MREVQHVAWHDEVQASKTGGKKVKALCGAKVYPMSEMSTDIPTCTPCHREVLRRHNERKPTVWTITASTWTSGGAA